MGLRRTMRRWFGSRYKQMSNREVNELDKQITAEMRAGTFRAVLPARGVTIPQPPTADELWAAPDPEPGEGRLPTMSSSITVPNRPPTSVSQRSRGNNARYYYDEFGDDYGGYQDGYGYGYGGHGGASSDSGYAAGYYGRSPPPLPLPSPLSTSSLPVSPMLPAPLRQPLQRPGWYVPGGGPFDLAEAKPESVYDGGGGSRANSMRSNMTRGSRPPPPVRPYLRGDSRAFSMTSDPGRMMYARGTPTQPVRTPYLRTRPSWNGVDFENGGEGGYGIEGGRGGGGGVYGNGNGNGYRGWNGESIGEHEYELPVENGGYRGGYNYPGG